uniref:Mitochondrial import inner membrane translocase subunit TIM44 n=2 Tax=Schistocephalus solidus TaxID=70667 RepID=A0A0X3PS95_SCHSO
MAFNTSLRNFLVFSSPRALAPTRYSSGNSFVQNLLRKIKEESAKDKQMKESVRKFREETEKLEKSKEIQSMREFYKKIESEIPTDTVDKLRSQISSVAEKIKQEGANIAKHEYVKKGVEGLSKAGEQLKDASRSIGDTEFVKSARESISALEKELQSDRALVYRAPDKPRTRKELSGNLRERIVEADTESSGVVLHKDSKWLSAWDDFKDNNQYVQKFFDLKTRYEESDHLLVRSVRFVTDKISDLFGGKSTSNELQTVLDEITKIDGTFTLEKFVRYCRMEVIPNVLESIIHGNMEVLKDWCYEAPFNVLSAPIKQTLEMGYKLDSRVLDVHNIDVHMGKMMEQGPVLIITFQAQQISCIRDSLGQVKEGDPEKVLRVTHVWALCRDQSEMNPWTAWRVLDIAMMPTEQWL